MNETAVTTRLAHVRWIGGGSGAGKSTVAQRLAARYNLARYETERFSRHIQRSDPTCGRWQAGEHGLQTIEVDGSQDVEQLTAVVAAALGLP